jgi:hypothetical protein
MAAKKIEIVYDINGKAIDVAIDKTLNLQQQAKALTAELRRTKEGSDEFKLLSTRLGDAQDGLAKTTAKSKDLFSSLSMLPGPVGMFFSQLSGSIELLKIFSSFTLKDITFQFKEVANDIGDIGENLIGLNEVQQANTAITEAEAAAVAELAAAENVATVSTEAHIVAVEAETVATEAAEVATIGLGAALKAIGIGLIIAAIATLVIYWDKISDAITGATDKTRAYDDAQKQVTKDITDFNVKLFEVRGALEAAKKGTISKKDALKEYNDKLGKTVGYAGDLTQAENLLSANTKTVIESIKLRAQAQIFYGKSAEASAKLVSGEGLKPDFWEQTFNFIKAGGSIIGGTQNNIRSLVDNITEAQDVTKKFADEGDKLTQKAIENDQKLKKGLAEPPKDAEKTQYQDEEIIKRARDLQEQLTAQQIKGEKERARAEIIADGERQVREIAAMKVNPKNPIAIKKQEELIANTKKQAELKALESDKKFDDEVIKQREEAAKKLIELEIKAIQEEGARSKVERYNQYLEEEINLKKSLDDKLITQKEYDTAVKNAHTAMVNDNQKIDDDAAELSREKMIAALQDELQVLEAQQKSLQVGTKAYYDNAVAIENQAYAIKIANAKNNAKQIEAINLEHAQNLKNIDLAAFEAKKQIEIQKYAIVASIGSSLQQLAGKNKALAIAGIVIEKAAAIGQIVANTQIANAKSLAASPLTFGQPWVAINTIAGVLSGAAVIAAASKSINEINGSGGDSGSGGSSGQNLGRNYADGGMIGGKRHAQGGTMIEAEAGEAIMTRGAVTMFAPLLSMMNQAGGGTSFSPNAMVSSYDNPKPSNDAVTEPIIKTYVVSSDMTSSQEKNARLKQLSTL